MIEIAKQVNEKGGGLIILLTVIIVAIGGLYKLHTKRLDKIDATLLHNNETAHSLDKRVLVLEIRNGN